MTTLREAAQQALEALEWFNKYGSEKHGPSLRGAECSLRAALAEPVQCSYCNKFFAQYRCSMESHGECDCPKCQGFCECRGIERTHGIGEKA